MDIHAQLLTGLRGNSSTSPGSRVPQPAAEFGAQQTGMQASAGRNDTTVTKTSQAHRLHLFESNLSATKTRCPSPPPSPSSTPTTYSFGPLSPHSFNSSVQTPPSSTVASFTHSRESSLDAGSTVNARARRDMIKGRLHHRGAASLDICSRQRHQRNGSRDWADLPKDLSRLMVIQSPHDFEPLEECIDEDLLKYRQEGQPATPSAIDVQFCDKSTVEAPAGQEVATVIAGDSKADIKPDVATHCNINEKEPHVPPVNDNNITQADRIANEILDREFGLQLGSTAPPEDVVEAVRQCLDEISLSLRSARGMGVLTATPDVPISQAAGSSSFPTGMSSLESSFRDKSPGSGRKRVVRDGEDEEDDMQEEGGGNGEGGDVTGYSDAGHRKKPKLEQYPCPFRKRNPHRFNCREWEYCAKAPFKSMTELKKHILKYHQQQQFTYKCTRRHAGFTKITDLQAHLRVDIANMCNVKPGPPPSLEDDEGITAAVGAQLRSRAQHYDWVRLWQALFPRDTEVPEPEFEPIVELHEVDYEFKSSLLDFQLQLQSTLDLLLSGWSPPSGRNAAPAAQLRHVVDGTLEHLFKDFVATTFQNSRDKVASSESSSSGSPSLSATTPSTQLEIETPEIGDTPSPAPLPPPTASSFTQRSISPAVRLPPTSTTRPTPRAILPYNPAQRQGSGVSLSRASSSASARYSLASSSNTSGSRLRDSMTAESVTSAESFTEMSINTSSQPQYQHQSGPQPPQRPLVLATSLRRQKQPAPMVFNAKFTTGNNNNSHRDSGITDVDDEYCPKCFSHFLNMGPCQCVGEGDGGFSVGEGLGGGDVVEAGDMEGMFSSSGWSGQLGHGQQSGMGGDVQGNGGQGGWYME